jgi:hypothetical protein
MPLALEQECRVRVELERADGEAEIRFVHGVMGSEGGPKPAKWQLPRI